MTRQDASDAEPKVPSWLRRKLLLALTLIFGIAHQWPRFAVFAPVIPLVHATLYARKLSAPPSGPRARREAQEAARTSCRTIQMLALPVIGTIAVLDFGPWQHLYTAEVVSTVGFAVWWCHLPNLNGHVNKAGIQRLAHEQSWWRNGAGSFHRVLLRRDGSRRPAPVVEMLMGALLSLSFTQLAASPYTTPAALGAAAVAQAEAKFSNSPKQQLAQQDGHLQATGAPAVADAVTPSALPKSPCSENDAKAAFATGVPASVADASFQAWRKVGGAIIGCPVGASVRSGAVYVTSLAGGQDTRAEIVFGDEVGTVIFSDFIELVNTNLSSITSIDERLPYGIGMNQLVHLQNRSCRLLQRYNTDQPALLPAGVTRVVLDVADHTGAMPRLLVSQPADGGGTSYDFELVAPRAEGGTRPIQVLSVEEAGGVAKWKNHVARDSDACPDSQQRLATVSQFLERAMHR